MVTKLRPQTVRLVTYGLHGHRAAYLELFKKLLPQAEVGSIPPDWSSLAVSPQPLFFLMLEEAPVAFATLATLRYAIGRRTVALLFRPREVVIGDYFKARVKRFVLRVLSSLPGVSVITILPFSLEPRFSQIATDWIDDPQLWDLTAFDPPEPRSNVVGEFSSPGRRTILSLGVQARSKGFDFFSKSWGQAEALRERFLFCAAGEFSEDVRVEKETFVKAGGRVVDRRLDDQELLSAYAAADFIWCCYAPDYDQGSGIFGRAVQLGRPIIVREGSFIEKLARAYDYPHIAVPFGDSSALVEKLTNASYPLPKLPVANARADASRARSLDVLDRALFR
ncbi:glycosyltransferase [Methylosinus sp. LW3]|uniref:glycosyltransferase n=1 Tax=Methylosinus sp. LW3 TaxID=107635 RepID=UPI0006840288|nr:glycosyltransferase [Methylosinus sp. LW3]